MKETSGWTTYLVPQCQYPTAEREVGSRSSTPQSRLRRALGGEIGGQSGDGIVVVGLGGHSAQGGSGVGLRVPVAGFCAPAGQGRPHDGPVPAGQVLQSFVGEHVLLPVGAG